MTSRSRAAEQSLPPQLGEQTGSRSRSAGKSREGEKPAKRAKRTNSGRQVDGAAASAPAAAEHVSDTVSQEDAAAAEQGPSSTTSSPLRRPYLHYVIKSQDSNRVSYESKSQDSNRVSYDDYDDYEPFDSATIRAYEEEEKKYTAKLERHKKLLTLSEVWSTTILDTQKRLPVQQSANAVFGLSSYIDGNLLARCSGFLIDWDRDTKHGTVLTSASLLCTKSPLVDLWSRPREYAPHAEVLVHLLDDTVVKGKLLNYHSHYNIALFDVHVNMSTELLVCAELVDYGQEVFLIGRDENLHLKTSHGRVERIGPGLYGIHDHHHFMYVNCTKIGAGGPVINTYGRVVGMADPTLLNAFIPISIILRCLRMWMDFKCVPRLHLGLKLSSIEFLCSAHKEEIRRMHKIGAGLIVQEVSEGCAAEKVGIRNGDVIKSLNGECFSTTVELEAVLLRICEDCLNKGSGLGSHVDLTVDLFQIRQERDCTKKLTLNVSNEVEVIAEGTYRVSASEKNSIDMSSGHETPRDSPAKGPAVPCPSGEGSEGGIREATGRPIGRDKAKKRRSYEGGSSSSSACPEVLQRMTVSREVVNLFQVEAEKIALKKEHNQLQKEAIENQRHLIQLQIAQASSTKQDREERIMSMDLHNVSACQRAYWEARQQEILQKRLNSSG